MILENCCSQNSKNPLKKLYKKPEKGAFYRCLIAEDFCVFEISLKCVENNPHNAYIFGTGGSRAFKCRVNHLPTTSVSNSRGPRFGPKI